MWTIVAGILFVLQRFVAFSRLLGDEITLFTILI